MSILKEEKYKFPLALGGLILLGVPLYLLKQSDFISGQEKYYNEDRFVQIEIKGPVKRPGIYSLKSPVFVTNLAKIAGGISNNYEIVHPSNAMLLTNNSIVDFNDLTLRKRTSHRWNDGNREKYKRYE